MCLSALEAGAARPHPFLIHTLAALTVQRAPVSPSLKRTRQNEKKTQHGHHDSLSAKWETLAKTQPQFSIKGEARWLPEPLWILAFLKSTISKELLPQRGNGSDDANQGVG